MLNLELVEDKRIETVTGKKPLDPCKSSMKLSESPLEIDARCKTLILNGVPRQRHISSNQISKNPAKLAD